MSRALGTSPPSDWVSPVHLAAVLAARGLSDEWAIDDLLRIGAALHHLPVIDGYIGTAKVGRHLCEVRMCPRGNEVHLEARDDYYRLRATYSTPTEATP